MSTSSQESSNPSSEYSPTQETNISSNSTYSQESSSEYSPTQDMAEKLNLNNLASSPHPLLERGDFSIRFDPECKVSSGCDVTVDMDGFVVKSSSLDAFHICTYGEARLYTTSKVMCTKAYLKKAELFPHLVGPMKAYDDFFPAFKIADTAGAPVYVVGRVCSNANDVDVRWLKENQQEFATSYWEAVFNQAVSRLANTRTLANNQPTTAISSATLPTYYRVYPEDLTALSDSLLNFDLTGTPAACLKFVYCTWKFGQQHRAPTDLSFAPEHFYMNEMFNLAKVDRVSIHVALNFLPQRQHFSALWLSDEIGRWIRRIPEKYGFFNFFGLSEVGNAYCFRPMVPLLETTVGDATITFLQMYTPYPKPLTLPAHTTFGDNGQVKNSGGECT